MRLYRRGRGKALWVTFNRNGVRYRLPTGCTSKDAAEKVAGRLAREVEAAHARGEVWQRQVSRDTATAVNDYERCLRQRKRSDPYIALTIHRLKRVLEGAHLVAMVTPEFLARALSRIAETPVQRVAGKAAIPSPQTVDGYRVAVVGFFRWLNDRGLRADNPAARLERAGQQPRVLRRRALTDAELRRLFSAALTRPLEAARRDRVHAGVTPPEEARLLAAGRAHALAYMLAARMGLRRSEVAGLRWADVDTRAKTLTVRAGVAKGRRESVLPLTPDTLEALQEARGSAVLTGAVLAAPPSVRTLRADLEAAGIPFNDEDGRADFHALRHSCATILARAGIAPQLLSDFMRHRSYATTRAYYQHLRLEDLRAVAAAVGGAAPAPAGRVPSGVPKVAGNGAQRRSQRALGAG